MGDQKLAKLIGGAVLSGWCVEQSARGKARCALKKQLECVGRMDSKSVVPLTCVESELLWQDSSRTQSIASPDRAAGAGVTLSTNEKSVIVLTEWREWDVAHFGLG